MTAWGPKNSKNHDENSKKSIYASHPAAG